MKSVSRLSLAFIILISLAGVSRAQIIPISVSGFNVDAIYGGNGDGTNGDVNGPGGTGFQYASQTYASENPAIFGSDPGLPANGTVVSSAAGEGTFQFQAYTADNILAIRGANATLTLAPTAQTTYSDISFLLNNLTYNANTTQQFVLNFADGSTTTLTTAQAVPYWVGGSPSYSLPTQSAGVAATYQPLTSGTGDNHDGTSIQFNEYDFVLDSADQGKTLDSITAVASSNPLDIYAVSGTIAVPEPGTWAMLLTGFGGLLFAGRLRARLTV
jgi:hypothetical protein